ncbi:RNA polymerase sigma-70 factor [Bacteroides sp. 519]|uniref:RNA polymerase sigma-70 factor n=1 Tax=Bacteroides sp. 519 TaxID=2302937 RepID=UPI0013D1505B|nr:RNA polymerase sigma-70 factor [Bacteroides sp. 519]NDV58641.1 RNA polymerase sigma-70 factor [Bacteroides sp. 519]
MNTNISNFQDLYDTCYRRAFIFAKSYVQNDMVAEDIVAESFVKLWKLMSEKEIEYPQALLFTALKNKALDYLRRESLRQTIEEELVEIYQKELAIRISTLEACNPQEMFSTEIEWIIRQTLDSLPEQTRQIFELSRYEGMPVKEIANKFNITPKAVEYHITRSLNALRTNLKDYLPFFLFFFN